MTEHYTYAKYQEKKILSKLKIIKHTSYENIHIWISASLAGDL